MKHGVLADIELREVKAKDLDRAAHRRHVGLGQPMRAHFIQRLRETVEILQQLSLLRERREESIYDLVYWHPKIVAELIQDAGGDWSERQSTLQLQEVAGK